MDKEKDLYIAEKLKQDQLISKKAEKVFENFFEREEFKMEEESKPKVSFFMKYKKLLATAACFVVIFGGANVYASMQGYDNIFFMIKEWIAPSKEEKNKNNILSDRDITISYKSIEVAKGLKVQINRLNIKDNQAKLFLNIDAVQNEMKTDRLTFVVTDDNENKYCEKTEELNKNIYTQELTLEGFKETVTKLNLKMIDKDNQKEIITFVIDLEKKEIEVIGNEKELEKISEKELKQYLGAFALLNYEDDVLNRGNLDQEVLENERKILTAIKISQINNVELYTNKNSSSSKYGDANVLNYENLTGILKSFTNIEFDDGGFMVVDKNGSSSFEDGYFRTRLVNNRAVEYVEQLNTYIEALCINTSDVVYSNGIYTVTFTYCYPDRYDCEIENLPVYEMTVGLMLNEDTTYSKYFLSSKMESKLVKPGKIENVNEEDDKNSNTNVNTNTTNNIVENITSNTINNNINTNNNQTSIQNAEISKFLGTWTLAYVMGNYENEKGEWEDFQDSIRNLYGEGMISIELTINSDGTFVETRSSSQFEEKYYGKYEISNGGDHIIKRTYNDTGLVVYTWYGQELATNEVVLSNVSLVNQLRHEYYKKSIDPLRTSVEGTWWRTFNVDHEESYENMIELRSDGRFKEEDRINNVALRGSYKIVQDSQWDIVVLTYDNGTTRKFLYGLIGQDKTNTLHDSPNRQVYTKVADYNSVG